MYIFFNTSTGQCIFFIDPFLSLIEVNVYFLNTNTGQFIFFNTNKGQCLFLLTFL